MMFYDSVGPNPRVVRVFAAERGITLPTTRVDLRGGENRKGPYLAKNPAGQMPCLELDDGVVIAEITAICEYLDEITPPSGASGPSLIGSTPLERAETRMWVRRMDLNIIEPMANGFRYAEGLKLFTGRIPVIPHAANDLKAAAREKLTWLDSLIAGRTWVCGDRMTLADIMLFVFIEFGAQVGQPLDPANTDIAAIIARMKSRPSAAA